VDREMRKILVTGAAGFIGSRICELLADSNTTVVDIDNFDPHCHLAVLNDNYIPALLSGQFDGSKLLSSFGRDE